LLRLHRNRDLLQRSDLVISNSRFLQKALQQRAGVDSHVVAPFIDTASLRKSMGDVQDRRFLTFVGLDAWKGAALALQLAEALPDRAFLFLEGARSSPELRERAGSLGNVTCLGWTPDMGPVFARTRVLLMPSAWEEPFGRLPVEAGACGVPTLASARGGLPEAVGDGGLLMDPADEVAHWIEGIRQLDDPPVYARLAEAARKHAETFELEVSLRHFEDLVRRELRVELGEHT
jgi:glycosyltransferase involved in cell wall biosynthesis